MISKQQIYYNLIYFYAFHLENLLIVWKIVQIIVEIFEKNPFSQRKLSKTQIVITGSNGASVEK